MCEGGRSGVGSINRYTGQGEGNECVCGGWAGVDNYIFRPGRGECVCV